MYTHVIIRCSAVHHSTKQYSRVQRSTARSNSLNYAGLRYTMQCYTTQRYTIEMHRRPTSYYKVCYYKPRLSYLSFYLLFIIYLIISWTKPTILQYYHLIHIYIYIYNIISYYIISTSYHLLHYYKRAAVRLDPTGLAGHSRPAGTITILLLLLLLILILLLLLLLLPHGACWAQSACWPRTDGPRDGTI